ncbi:MAG: diguanylate cyclase [Burkholderiales bacterium]
MYDTSSATKESLHTVSFLREVLSRLAAFKLPPTPENFAWVYRQLQREQDLPVSAEYVNDLAVLEHAMAAFDQLFVADAWLNGKLGEMRELLVSTGVPESKKRQQVKALLGEIETRKEELLYHLAESSLALKSAITEVVREIGRLSASVGGFQTNLTKYQDLVDGCHDLSDARRVMSLVAHDTKKLNESLYEHESAMGKNFSKLQESGAMILSNLSQHAQTKVAEIQATADRKGLSALVLPAEQLLKRLREPDLANGVLLLMELADRTADEARIKRFSELLATKVERQALLGYWGDAQFVFVMPNVGPARALVLAREIGKLIESLARGTAGDRLAESLAFGYGIASYQDNDSSAQSFYKAYELAYGNLRPMRDVLAN